ncbi:hypothetical protein PsorP6_000045 [Peronosclerospora sorghi]|uniref:Uncharacterized protein n=1 Tax=Peronosclerospora sorghi TaxID=230839 RepID=A0ACC0WPU2_9STRA|nr:hypothetical protein PsorP6_000045 [Peronosclerospora sorghi]
MGSTYKTNRYKLPLLHVIGVTRANQNVSLAYAFLSEKATKITREFCGSFGVALESYLVAEKSQLLSIESLHCRWNSSRILSHHCPNLHLACQQKRSREDKKVVLAGEAQWREISRKICGERLQLPKDSRPRSGAMLFGRFRHSRSKKYGTYFILQISFPVS